MKYYEKILQPDETVKLVARPHWVVYGRAFFFGALGLAALVLAQQAPSVGAPALWVALALFALGLLVFLRAWIFRVTTEIVVTDRRVIHKRGVISRHTEEMNVSKVE